ncbi:mitochondrial 2-oxodicarboxylate carrier [Ciona intestinalis]|nr:mitochondrial 2-oxodicarboxylate carrier isoform X2 [Ciona intestinalis]|eukprot:XP_002130378.1 mitochondrial 2-oxodicarboxylate carrier isoform X2 [Ciona intestinalis]
MSKKDAYPSTQGMRKPDVGKVTYKRMFQQLVAGGGAGLVEICLMHPLDVVKTRFQLQGSGSSVQYRSVAHCFGTMYRTEGFLSFYKGILPPILAETPKRAVKFFCFERYQHLFSGGGDKTPLVYSLAGLCSGLTEGLVCNPFERIKILLQSEKDVKLKDQESTFSKARQIIRNEGFGMKGINRGLTATLGRHGVWNMVYFGVFHSFKEYIPKSESQTQQVVYKLCLGLTAGTLASVINIPYDVAKSRIQGPQPIPGQIKYYGAHSTIVMIYKEEGFLALYKGLVPKFLRLGPSGAIMMFVYESLSEFLAKKYP